MWPALDLSVWKPRASGGPALPPGNCPQEGRGSTREGATRGVPYDGARSKTTPDGRGALGTQLLAGSPRVATEETLVLGHGFKLQMLTGLVRAKLAKRYRVTVKAGGRTIGGPRWDLGLGEAGALRAALRPLPWPRRRAGRASGPIILWLV
jgi:hypothetical protein